MIAPTDKGIPPSKSCQAVITVVGMEMGNFFIKMVPIAQEKDPVRTIKAPVGLVFISKKSSLRSNISPDAPNRIPKKRLRVSASFRKKVDKSTTHIGIV